MTVRTIQMQNVEFLIDQHEVPKEKEIMALYRHH